MEGKKQVIYDELPLSNKEKISFFFVVFAIGLAVGKLFYESIKIGTIVAAALCLYFPKYKQKKKEKHKSELLLQFRDMLYSISSSISVGRSMSQALEESINFWEATYEESDYIMIELRSMVNRIKNSNEKDITVLKDFARRANLEDVSDFVTVYEATKESGGNLVKAINRATTIIGDKITLEKELKVLMTEKAFEGRIVGAAPFLIMLFLRLTSPEYLEPLTSTTKGHMIATIALVFIGFAMLMIERINSIEV